MSKLPLIDNLNLKPCPKCGGKAMIQQRWFKGRANLIHYKPICSECSFNYMEEYKSIRKAISKWNCSGIDEVDMDMYNNMTKEELIQLIIENELIPINCIKNDNIYVLKQLERNKQTIVTVSYLDQSIKESYELAKTKIEKSEKENKKMIEFIDKKNRFVETFNPETGFYTRTGIFDENGKDTGVDPFMRCFPSLIDIGIMERCVCASKCKVDCYQKACDRTGKNMSLENYKKIMEESKGKVFQIALGGAGDPDTHENFKEILEMTREYGIVPNFTTSGIAFTKEKAELCKKMCGAVAVSEHNADYTEKALDMLIEAGVKTNIHYVLSAKSIDDAINKLKNNGFHKGINAVVFLMYKPIGLGRIENILTPDNSKVKEFFELIDTGKFDFKIGFDSCSCAGIINNTKNINLDSIDFCEGGRHSMYIDASMHAMPCSFGNQDSKWYVDLNNHTIQEAWDGEVFEKFRYSLRNSCPNCKKRGGCAGGCPICRDIVLCDNSDKELV